MNELVQQLVTAVGVNEEQAQGGAGLLLNLVKEKLSANDFSKVAESIPGIESLLDAAPQEGNGLLGSIISMIPGLASGGLGGLAAGFSKLGLDPEMIVKFVPLVIGFIQNQGGDATADLVKKALNQESG
ncbi:MAG: hypothetical protein ACI9W6_000051 [Motiliproteus sp.]|jgi:hypothetical protein